MGCRIVAVIVGIEYLTKNDATMTMCNSAESEIGNKEICSPNPKTVDASTKFRALALSGWLRVSHPGGFWLHHFVSVRRTT